MFLQGHHGDSVLLPWLQPRLVEGGDGAGELGNHTALVILSGNETSINSPPPAAVWGGNDAQRGGAPRVASFHSPLCIPKSHGHLDTPQHGGRKMKSPTKRGALVLLGCKVLPIPPSLLSFCVFVPVLYRKRKDD